MSPTRLSATDRLNQLPEVFTVEEFQTSQNLSAKAASVYLARWQEQNKIGRLGPRSGVWVNLTKAEAIEWRHRRKALELKHPDAIIGGAAAVALEQGQPLPALLDIIVPQGTSKAQIDGIVLHQRSTRQHALLATKATSTHADLPVLPAEVALADLWVHGELEAISPTPEQRQSAEACAFEIGLKKPNKNR
jgi:hypothetical protein